MVKLSIPFAVAAVALNIAPIIAVPISAGNDLEIRDLDELDARGAIDAAKKVMGGAGKIGKTTVNAAKGVKSKLGLRELEGDHEIYTRAETTTADLEIRDFDALEARLKVNGGIKTAVGAVKGMKSKLGFRELEGDSDIYTRAETTPADLETRDIDELETRALSGGLAGLRAKLKPKLGGRELEGDSEIYTRALTTTTDLEKRDLDSDALETRAILGGAKKAIGATRAGGAAAGGAKGMKSKVRGRELEGDSEISARALKPSFGLKSPIRKPGGITM